MPGLILLCIAGQGDLLAQTGGKAGAFLRFGIGARAKGMGDAQIALARGVDASFYNPAGLPLLNQKQVLASYRFLSLDREFSFIGFATPVRPKVSEDEDVSLNGGMALAWLRSGVGDIDGRTTDGSHFDDLSNSENAIMFAFALNPVTRLSLGVVVKVVWSRFPNLGLDSETISASGVGFDIGVLYRLSDHLALAATVKEINAKYRWNTQDLYDEDGSESIDAFPKAARYGVALQLPRYENITLAVDFEQFFRSKLFQKRLEDRLHIGAEGIFVQDILVRAGFDDNRITLGAGYRFPLFGKSGEINYAYATPGDRPEEEHVFTWVFNF